MRVTILSADDRVLDRRIAQQACELAQAGHMVSLVLLVPGTTLPESLPGEIRIVDSNSEPTARQNNSTWRDRAKSNIRVLSIYHWLLSFARPAQRWARLANFNDWPQQCDLIIANDLPCLLPALQFRQLHPQQSMAIHFDAHEIYHAQTDAIYSRRLSQYWLEQGQQLVPQSNTISTVTQGIADHLAADYKLTSTITVVENCCPFVPMKELRQGKLQQLIGCEHDRKLVVCAGEIRPGRNLEELILAIPHLQDPQVSIVLMGQGNPIYIDQLRQLAQQMSPLDPQRCHIGHRVPPDQVVTTVSDASLGVITNRGSGPNNSLGGPNRVYEYIQARVPILSFQHQGIRGVLSKTETGHMLAWHDPEALALAITETLGMPIAPNTLEAAAHEYAWEREFEKLQAGIATGMARQRHGPG